MQLSPVESFGVSPVPVHQDADRWKTLSQELLDAFPSQKDVNVLCKYDLKATYFLFQLFARLTVPEAEAVALVNDLALIPGPSTHPVLLARRMLMLALLPPHVLPEHNSGLSEPSAVVAKRLADTAIRLVTSNDQLVGCTEVLQCIVLEGMYHSNHGNLRLAWLAFKRAIVTAQLMRMDRPHPPPMKSLDHSTKSDPKSLWLRIV